MKFSCSTVYASSYDVPYILFTSTVSSIGQDYCWEPRLSKGIKIAKIHDRWDILRYESEICRVIFSDLPTWLQMNRLVVCSYLTRYPYGHTGTGKLVTVTLPDTRILLSWHDPLWKAWQSNPAASQEAGRTAFPGSDVGLDTARVR